MGVHPLPGDRLRQVRRMGRDMSRRGASNSTTLDLRANTSSRPITQKTPSTATRGYSCSTPRAASLRTAARTLSTKPTRTLSTASPSSRRLAPAATRSPPAASSHRLTSSSPRRRSRTSGSGRTLAVWSRSPSCPSSQSWRSRISPRARPATCCCM